MISINFRLLHIANLESYRMIRLECLANYPDHFGDTYEEELNTTGNKFYEALRSNDSTSFLFGAFSGDSLIGICGFIQESRSKAKHRGTLVQVYTDPHFSGQGIGSELVRLTIAKAFGNALIDQILLSVVYTNDKAVNLYKKFGFIQYGILENYFKQGEMNWAQLFMVLTRENYSLNK